MIPIIFLVPVQSGSAPNQVRRHRRMADLTQQELAAAAGVSRQTIVAIEGGDYAPSVLLALRVAGVLGTTVEELYDVTVEPNRAPGQAGERG